METTAMDAAIPSSLRGPLTFGDVDQIGALKDWDREHTPPEGKNRYEVEVDIMLTETVTVDAENEDEAKELAIEEIDLSYSRDVSYAVKEI